MSLPAPNLDDRTFQQIVDEVKIQIGRRCPEWTDHNVSDPGVTLIELFAWMTEMMLYRMNQVPERNYVKFLEMIGVQLEPPVPAMTELRFFITQPIPDDDTAIPQLIRAREATAATLRTETEEAIEFTTDEDLNLVRPHLVHRIAVQSADAEVFESGMEPKGARSLALPGGDEQGVSVTPVPLFTAENPREGDAFYLGFDTNISGNVVELIVDASMRSAVGLDVSYPPRVWQSWNSEKARWEEIEILADTTYGFIVGERTSPEILENLRIRPNADGVSMGRIQMAMPHRLTQKTLGNRSAYWVRCLYTLQPKGAKGLKASPLQESPLISTIRAQTIGGTVSSSNSASVKYRELGVSDGTPGQIFSIGQAPILPLEPKTETLLVGDVEAPYERWQRWTRVDDFADSKEDDLHFTCDIFTGEIALGPNIIAPNGKPLQFGNVPDKGKTLVLSGFRYGGGLAGNVTSDQIVVRREMPALSDGQGNVPEGSVSILKSSIPYIADVMNPRPAYGGKAMESLEHAKLRAQRELRLRERAVTSEDYEALAMRVEGVARARCVPAGDTVRVRGERRVIPPGAVRMLIVPALDSALVNLSPEYLDPQQDELQKLHRRVAAYLDERRLLTSLLEVDAPEYVYVSTDITLIASPNFVTEQVRVAVIERLSRFLHPIQGGERDPKTGRGSGWEFGRRLTISDLYSQLRDVPGVGILRDVKMFRSEFVAGTFTDPVETQDFLRIESNQLLCTRSHSVTVIPMWEAGYRDTEGDR